MRAVSVMMSSSDGGPVVGDARSVARWSRGHRAARDARSWKADKEDVADRRAFLHTLAGAVLATPLAVRAQETKVWRIGLLGYVFDPAHGDRWKALRDRLRELG
jgi:hypothetical protein